MLASKRTALLERRGLFDFVSPFIVFLAVLTYLLFAAFVIYIRQHPFPGFAGLINLVGVTLLYAFIAFTVYMHDLWEKEPIRLSRTRIACARSGWQREGGVYTCIVTVAFLSLRASRSGCWI